MRMDVLYRIYTEDINRAWVIAYVSAAFDSFTLIPSTGVWKGAAESSLVIEIVGNRSVSPAVYGTAVGIKAHNNQDAILITQHPIEGVLI